MSVRIGVQLVSGDRMQQSRLAIIEVAVAG